MGIKMDKMGLYVNDKGLKRRKRRCQMMAISWLIREVPLVGEEPTLSVKRVGVVTLASLLVPYTLVPIFWTFLKVLVCEVTCTIQERKVIIV